MYEDIIKEIKKNKEIVIFGHIFPDGDCYGSQIALRESLKLAFPDKRIYACGSGYPRFTSIFGLTDDVSDEIIQRSLGILVDCNDFSRIEEQRFTKAKSWIKIDHHIDTGLFDKGPSFVNDKANSTCEIVLDIIREKKLPINSLIAGALFLGIVTDSVKFQYIEDFKKAFNDAAYLCECGANPDIINSALNVTKEKLLKFKGYIFSHYKKTENGFIYIYLNQKTLKKFNLSSNHAATMVNLLGNIKGYPIWGFFCQEESGSIKSEFRSNGPIIQPVAFKYGGGGHNLACGVTLKNKPKQTMKLVINDLDLVGKKYIKEN